jgi:GNAT superfamily N-acetyltransferase
VLGWQVGYRGLLPQQVLDELTAAERLPRWTAAVGTADWPGRGTIVAVENNRVVGFADFRPTHDHDNDPDEVGEIASLYVHPRAWGRGVGSALVTFARDQMTIAGRSAATLWVLDNNYRAITFHQKGGWMPDGATRSDLVGSLTVRDLRYRCVLGAA